MDIAERMIGHLSSSWRPERYRDTYTKKIHEVIAKKEKGKTIRAKEEPMEPTRMTHLMKALEASFEKRKTKARVRA